MTDVEIIQPSAVEPYTDQPRRWNLQQLAAAWLSAKSTSEATKHEYRHDFEQYRTWCEDMGLDVLTVGTPEVQMYGEHLARQVSKTTGKPLSAKTRARKLSTVSSFYTYAVRAGGAPTNPAREAERPRYDRRYSPTQSLSETEATAMLAAVPGLRQRVMAPTALHLSMMLMVNLGARVTEVCSIDLADLGQRRGMRAVTMRAKGHQIRVRPVTAQLAPVLDAWIQDRPDWVGQPALLVDNEGRRITRQQVAKLITRLAKAASVREAHRVTPHSCRHAFNEIAKARGASLKQRQAALGHASSDTTDLYDHQGADLASDPAHLVSAATYTPPDDEEPGEQQ